MPPRGKSEAGKAGDAVPIGETEDNTETFDEALIKAGSNSAKVGRKIVSKGKRRETLKKWPPKSPGK
ncbi:hypothetical protein ATY79_08670 [Rhizobium sp. R693]|nr:hypothetical protein ATY79_08670 [Rhizobium sp. R693]